MSGLHLFRIVVMILINTPSDVKGLLLCGVPGAFEVYRPGTICCNRKTHPKVDVGNRKRDCCHNMLYYIDQYECVNGKLQSLNPPDPSPSAPSRRKKKEPKIRIVRINFLIDFEDMKNNSEQNIRATVERLNEQKLNMTKHGKLWKAIRINIST